MKVLFFGNQDNLGYTYVTWLRSRGVDASLAFYRYNTADRSKISWVDEDFDEDKATWIIKYNRVPILRFFRHKRAKRKLIEECDLIISSGEEILEVLQYNKPIVFIPTGIDLSSYPFRCSSLKDEVLSYLYRKRISKVNKILIAQSDCIWAARLIGVGTKVIRWPLLVDANNTKNNLDRGYANKLKEKYQTYDFVLLSSTRKNLNPNSHNYKATEKVLPAFRKFIDDNPEKNIRIVFGMHGHDVEQFQELVYKYDLDSYSDYIDHLPAPKLHAFFTLDNLFVFDQFTENEYDSLNGTLREALSVGAIVFTSTNVKSKNFEAVYGKGCEAVVAVSENEIYEGLSHLSSLSKDEIVSIRSNNERWLYNSIHWEKRIDEFINILKDSISR